MPISDPPIAHTSALSTNDNDVTTPGIDTTGANLIVVVVTTFAGSAGPSDSKGNTWIPLTPYENPGDRRVQLFYCFGGTVGSGHTFSFSETGKFPGIAVIALSGAAAVPFDQENGGITALGTTIATGSVTPSEDNEILIAGYSGYGFSIDSIDSGFTLLESQAFNGHALVTGLAYKVQTTASPENPIWTLLGMNASSATIATFKAAAGGGGGGNRRRRVLLSRAA